MSVDSIGRAGSPPPMPSGVGADIQATQAGAAGGVSNASLAAILKEMQDLTVGQDKSGAKAPPGAPALAPPSKNFSAEDSALILQTMQNKLTDSQIKTTKEGIKLDQEQKQRLHEEAMKKIEEAAKKLAESNKLGVFGKVFGIISKVATIAASIAGCVAAVALMAGTAGAGTPAAIALFAISATSLTLATVDLASDISQAAGGPAFSLGGGIGKAVTEILKATGMDEDKAEMAGQITGMVVDVAVAVSLAVASIAVAPFTGGASLTATAASVAKFAQIAGAVANGVGGVVDVVSTGTSIAQGVNRYEATNAQADKLDIDKIIEKLQQQIQDNTERVEELVQQMEEAMQAVNSILAGSNETQMQIARRMV